VRRRLELLVHGGARYSDVSAEERHLVGREEELHAILRFLDARVDLPGAVVLPGEAGIGKTSLWLATLEAATTRGYRTLSARPSEAETLLAFSVLADLLASDSDEVLPELPPIQRRALEGALLLGEAPLHADDRAIGSAFLGAVRILARNRPVCLAVDDVQWLDAASLSALRYALARLEDEPVALLLAARGNVPEWLRRAVSEERLRTIDVGGLSLGATYELIRARLHITFPRPTLVRLWETAQGNPFFALELAAALQRRGGALTPGEELPIPTDLDELLQARLAGLGPDARDVAHVVAALAEPSVALVEAALEGRSERGLTEVLDARIIELDGERVRFTHPLLASAVAAHETPKRRRSLHARLAAIVPSAEERARHLALATSQPDDDVAAILEEAAATAQARGAPAEAAELVEEALRLTPVSRPNDARRRVFMAAEMHDRSGDKPRAIGLLEGALEAAAPGTERATVLVHLADLQSSMGDSIRLYRDALAEAGDDGGLQATIHLSVAIRMRWSVGAEQGLEHARLAVDAAFRASDDAIRCRALAAYGELYFRSGRGIPAKEMNKALELERLLPGSRLQGVATLTRCEQLCWSADVEGARAFLPGVRAAAETTDDPAAMAAVLWFLGFNEWRGGNWEEADRYATESVELFTQLGQLRAPYELPLVFVAAHRGRTDEARARATGAIARAQAEGIRIAESAHGWALGFVQLSLGHVPAALEYLRASYRLRNAFHLEPAARLELGDLLEALIATGEHDEAEDIIATWEERSQRLDRAWALAILARARGLLLAARGDLDGAFASFDRALAEHDRSSDPFHHARTLLALGRTQRRAKRRGAARETLEDALSRFEALGAPLWAEQTRIELARIGGRAPTRDSLTQAESRIAALVAEGRTNREVAAALFLTEHSVETALTRVYRKLGIRSRSELASHYASNS
jgi:DNA-binding CsgD family transcriptional regulator